MNTKNPTGRIRSTAIIAAQKRNEKRRRLLLQGGIGLVVVAAVLGTTIAVLKSQDADPSVAPPPGLTAAGGVVVGNADAPVTVTVVEDFGCPHCRAFESEAGGLLSSYEAGQDVKVEYRGIAFLDRAFETEYSSRALNASACVAANSPSEVWKKFHLALFAQQPAEGSAGLSQDQLVDTAAGAGADDAATATCISEGTYRSWVTAQTEATLGNNGVEGTPTVFVNGTKVEQPSSATIEAAVAQASR